MRMHFVHIEKEEQNNKSVFVFANEMPVLHICGAVVYDSLTCGRGAYTKIPRMVYANDSTNNMCG